MAVISPNMNLIISTVGVDSGLSWEQNLNSSLTLLDGHDHSPGKGVPISSAGISVSSDLPLNNNNLTLVRSIRFNSQPLPLSGPMDLGCLYESGVDLWFNDGNGNQVQITSGGTVNATSSGIASGTATASFVSSVLVVNAASNTPANIQGASLLLGNNLVNSKFVTLSSPSALAANYNLVLPSLPAQTNLLTLDTSGNIAANANVDGTTLSFSGTVLSVATHGVGSTQLAAPIYALSSSSSNFSTNSTSFVNVTNLSVTIIASNSRPVIVQLVSDGTNSLGNSQEGFFSVSGVAQLQILEDGATLRGFWAQPTSGSDPGQNPLVCTFIPSPGSHTYTVQTKTTGSGASIYGLALLAHQLN